MSDENHGVTDPTPTGAQGATDETLKPERSINAQAKDLPWVKDLMRDSAELARIKSEQDEAAAEAERLRAESEKDYEKAKALADEKYKTLETQHLNEVKQLKLEAAFAHAGLNDPRLVAIFAAEYNNETPAVDFVESIKKDPKNAAYFGTQRQALKPPRPAGEPPPDDFEPERDLQSWLKSNDPKKRDRAIQYNREKYARQLTVKG